MMNDFNFLYEEPEKIIQEFDELLEKIERDIAENYDDRVKAVGDHVKVWDGSSLTDMCGNERLVIEPPFTNREYFIVVAIHQEEMYKSEVLDVVYETNQDLIVVDPETKERFRVSSESVKIID